MALPGAGVAELNSDYVFPAAADYPARHSPQPNWFPGSASKPDAARLSLARLSLASRRSKAELWNKGIFARREDTGRLTGVAGSNTLTVTTANGAAKLRPDPTAPVFDDLTTDTLTGGLNLVWFFLAPTDSITDQNTGGTETVTSLP